MLNNPINFNDPSGHEPKYGCYESKGNDCLNANGTKITPGNGRKKPVCSSSVCNSDGVGSPPFPPSATLQDQPLEELGMPYINRFVQPDSIVPNPSNPQAWNRLSYVGNRPVNFNDPTGHAYCDFIDSSNSEDCNGGLKNSQTSSVILKKVKNKKDKEENTCSTVTCKVFSGDIEALGELLTPTHVGWRVQLEGTIWVLSGTVGGNWAYNFKQKKSGWNIDWSIGGGPGVGKGISITTGPIGGWASSNIKDVTSGSSRVFSASSAVGPAGTLAISGSQSDPINFHVDPYFGQVPVTIYLGGGAGGAFADAGMSILSGTFVESK